MSIKKNSQKKFNGNYLKGDKKENKSGGCFTGFKNKIEIPANEKRLIECQLTVEVAIAVNIKIKKCQKNRTFWILLTCVKGRMLVHHFIVLQKPQFVYDNITIEIQRAFMASFRV